MYINPLQSAFVFVLAFGLFSNTVLNSVAAPQEPSSLPNIVIIYADDMGYGDLAIANGESKIPTPHLDQLARDGMRFTDAHSSSGICTPSRYALLTGRYHWRKFHSIVGVFGESRFDPKRITLPEMLQSKGYRTACVGKWHLGWDWNRIKNPNAKTEKKGNRQIYGPEAFDWSKPIPDGPLSHGFDYYYGDDVPNFPPYSWIENDRVVDPPTLALKATPKTAEGNWEARPGPMTAGWELDKVVPQITKKAVDWIGRQKDKDKPFFLYFPLTSPHAPIVPAKSFVGKSEAGGYGDFMFESDWAAGQVLKALDDNGFRENTLVIFTSDNGPERYAYERVRKYGHRSMGPLRGLKRDIWEGGHRVPMIVRWPGNVRSGQINNQLVSQIDIMATLSEIVRFDLDVQTAEDSFNLLPYLDGSHSGKPIRDSLVHNTFKGKYAIRSGNHVLIDGKDGYGSREPQWYSEQNGHAKNEDDVALFDLTTDLGQKTNIASRYPDRINDMRELLKKIREDGRSAPRLMDIEK